MFNSYYVENAGVNLYTEYIGDPRHSAVLLINGAHQPLCGWPQMFCESLMQAGHYVIRYNQRDMERSTHMRRTHDVSVPVYTIHDLAHDVRVILDAYGIQSAHVIGHSMGGYIALLFAHMWPERVTSVGAISAGPTGSRAEKEQYDLPDMDPQSWEKLKANKPTGDFASDIDGWMDAWHICHGDIAIDRNMAREYTRALYAYDADYKPAVNHMAAMHTLPHDLAKRVQSISVPVLVMHGQKDVMVPVEHGRCLSRLVPNATYVELQSAGHVFFNKHIWQLMVNHIGMFLNVMVDE